MESQVWWNNKVWSLLTYSLIRSLNSSNYSLSKSTYFLIYLPWFPLLLLKMSNFLSLSLLTHLCMCKLLIFVYTTLLTYCNALLVFSVDSLGVSMYGFIPLAYKNTFALTFQHACLLYFPSFLLASVCSNWLIHKLYCLNNLCITAMLDDTLLLLFGVRR